MEELKALAEKMEKQLRNDLAKDGDLENTDDEGIRIAVYEDLRDTLKFIYSDVAYD